jgi:CoA:oxalate CoA-transferase
VLHDPQLLARNMVVTVAAEGAGPVFTAAGNPIKMTGLPDPDHRDHAPALGAHRDLILQWLEE